MTTDWVKESERTRAEPVGSAPAGAPSPCRQITARERSQSDHHQRSETRFWSAQADLGQPLRATFTATIAAIRHAFGAPLVNGGVESEAMNRESQASSKRADESDAG